MHNVADLPEPPLPASAPDFGPVDLPEGWVAPEAQSNPGVIAESVLLDGQPIAPIPLTQAPVVVSLKNSNATVTFKTKAAARAVLCVLEVNYQYNFVLGHADRQAFTLEHSLLLERLHPVQVIRFYIILSDQDGNPYKYPADLPQPPQASFAFTTANVITDGQTDFEPVLLSGSSPFISPGGTIHLLGQTSLTAGPTRTTYYYKALLLDDARIQVSPPSADIQCHWYHHRTPAGPVPLEGQFKNLPISYWGIEPSFVDLPALRITAGPHCAPGHYSVTAPIYSVTDMRQDIAWSFEVLPKLGGRVAFDPPAIPGLDKWQATMVTEGKKYADPAFIYSFGVESQVWFYDGCRVMQQIYDLTGEQVYLDSAINIGRQYVDYVLSNKGAIPAYRIFASGLAMLYWRTGDQTYAAAINAIAKGTMADAFPNEHIGYQRESAYLATTMIRAAQINRSEHSQLRQAIDMCLSDAGNTCQYDRFNQPFFTGLSLMAAIAFYEYSPDPKIPAFVARVLDWMWDSIVVRPEDDATGGKAGYTAYNALSFNWWPGCPRPNSTGAIYTGLNNLFSFAWAWLYNLTGDDKYRERGDLLFSHACDEIIYSGKGFSQIYMLSFDYVKYRSSSQVTRSYCTPPAA